MVTGSGCSLGSVIASFLAVDGLGSQGMRSEPTGDPLLATLAGVLAYEVAAENVEATGPGSFLAGFLDALFQLRSRVEQEDFELQRAFKVQVFAS